MSEGVDLDSSFLSVARSGLCFIVMCRRGICFKWIYTMFFERLEMFVELEPQLLCIGFSNVS